MELDREQIDKLRLGAITAIDGLWFLSVENHLDFDTALKIDLDVWKNYGIIILKRMGKMAGRPLGKGELIDLPTVKFFLETLSKIDGTEYASEFLDDSTLEFKVHRCPWYENLKKAGREKVVPCEMIDQTIFGHWLEAIDSGLSMEFTKSVPRGDDHCAWIVRRKQ